MVFSRLTQDLHQCGISRKPLFAAPHHADVSRPETHGHGFGNHGRAIFGNDGDHADRDAYAMHGQTFRRQPGLRRFSRGIGFFRNPPNMGDDVEKIFFRHGNEFSRLTILIRSPFLGNRIEVFFVGSQHVVLARLHCSAMAVRATVLS